MENPRSVQLVKAAAWLIVLGSILATVIIQADTVKHFVIEHSQGLPLVDKVYAGDDPATEAVESRVAVAVNNEGQVDIFISFLHDSSSVQSYHIQGPYLIGSNRRYIAPEVQFIDVEEDGSLELILVLNGEVFAYGVSEVTGLYEYNSLYTGVATQLLNAR